MDLPTIITQQSQKLLETISTLNLKLMTIESMTGGAIINSLTNIPNYSDHIYGALIVYNTLAKTTLLSLPTENIYSLNYAYLMCAEAYEKHNVDIILSITGNANFIENKSVFYIGVSVNNIISTKEIILDYQELSISFTPVTRETVKNIAVKTILEFANSLIN